MNIYEKTYQAEWEKLTPGMQKRVLAVKEKPDLHDPQVEEFVKNVIVIAES